MTSQIYTRTIQEVAQRIESTKANGGKCCLFIGAGCSVSAGIPASSGFVTDVRNKYPAEYNRALFAAQETDPHCANPGYFHCMEQLADHERWILLQNYVDRAHLSWSHLCVALLMRHGYVDRVLTTNFDPLIERACGIFFEFPGVYDLRFANRTYRAEAISAKAVLYLHGRFHGFSQIMTEQEMQDRSYLELVRDVIRDSNQNRLWIIAGYSGTDPVFEALAQVNQYSRCLYWIGFQSEGPRNHVRDRLLQPNKYAYYVRGNSGQFDADWFFLELCTELGIFSPLLLQNPDDYIQKFLDLIEQMPPDPRLPTP